MDRQLWEIRIDGNHYANGFNGGYYKTVTAARKKCARLVSHGHNAVVQQVKEMR